MAKTYYNSNYDADSITHSYSMGMSAPFDSRAIVDTYDDLFNKSTFKYAELYVGMMVTTADTQDVYVLSVKPKPNVTASNWPNTIVWKKINISEINPADNLEYYRDKLGAKIVDSVNDLTNPNLEAFVGMFAVVIDSNSDSEDESGLYVLRKSPSTTITNWYRVLGGSNGGAVVSGLDVADVITFDGSTPNAGSGFSIEKDGEFVEEDFADVKLEAGKFYTSNGINSYAANVGSKLEGVDYITLTNGGESFIRLYSNNNNNWITLNIVDNSLGISTSDVKYIVNNEEVTMSSSSLTLPKGTLVSFAYDINLRGMTERRGTDSTTYTFGTEPGSDYEDVDIYTTNILPTVYAYLEGTQVRVLTEGDKADIINKISENTFEFNVQNHILRLVH